MGKASFPFTLGTHNVMAQQDSTAMLQAYKEKLTAQKLQQRDKIYAAVHDDQWMRADDDLKKKQEAASLKMTSDAIKLRVSTSTKDR